MTGLWEETLDRCDFNLELARRIEQDDPKRAEELTDVALSDAECVLTWIEMTGMLNRARDEARRIP